MLCGVEWHLWTSLFPRPPQALAIHDSPIHGEERPGVVDKAGDAWIAEHCYRGTHPQRRNRAVREREREERRALTFAVEQVCSVLAACHVEPLWVRH